MVDTDLAEGAAGAATRRRAIDEFIESNSILESTTIRGNTISYEGEAVGTLTLVERSAGGFAVVAAEWCYPD